LNIGLLIHPHSERYLSFSDAEHFGATGRARPLGGGFAILHGDGFGILDLLLGTALYTISLHSYTSFL
jgi:hypothetical protein